MPEAAAVISAARAFMASNRRDPDDWVSLGEALEALDAKLASIGAEPSKEEQDRTWGEVVAGDEILSAKTKKWYEVHTSVRTPEGKMKIMIKKAPQPIVRPASDPVRVRRGVDGEAVDILEVLFSGQTRPTMIPAGKAIGPMIKTKEEEEEADDDDE
jgi:hypothetical protein